MQSVKKGAFFMAGMRLTGLISGMDTESMVKELIKASSTKVDNVRKDKQTLEWKKEAWQDLNTKIYNFYKNELSVFKTNGTYKSKKVTASNNDKVSVTAANGASLGTHTVSVKQLASSAYLTGAKITSGDNNYSEVLSATASTNFADMTGTDGSNLGLSGSTISFSYGTNTIEFELGGTGENGVANLKELNEKLKANENFKGLSASIADGGIVFTNDSAVKNSDGVYENGVNYTIQSSNPALGLNGDIKALTGAEGETNKLNASGTVNYVNEFTAADIKGTTKLKDIGIAVGTTFTVNGQDFVVDDETTLKSFTEGLSKFGVSANYDAGQGRIYINAGKSGKANDFNVTSSDANALELLGLGSGAKKIDGQDAIIDYNGVEYTSETNVFKLNNLTITAKGVTGEYDPNTGSLSDNVPISLTVESDTQDTYKKVKDFVKKYNELIDEMNSLYDEKKTTYEPLTDEEKQAMSDDQIEKWEKEAKKGLLRRDSTINTLLQNMRNILNKAVTVTDADGNQKQYTLASLGIVTGNYQENGKLHILGDEEDPDYASETNKLKQMLDDNPDVLAQVFAGSKENPGIGFSLYDSLNTSMKKTSMSSSLTFFNDIQMDDELEDFDDEIDKQTKKLQAMEDKYYDQFAAMEAAMAKLQSQQSYIAQLMGMA